MRRSANPLRRALFAFGLLAVLTLLLQPVCNAYEGQHQPDGELACCLDMQLDAVAASPSQGGKNTITSDFTVVRSLPDVALAPAGISGGLAVWKDPPPPPPSYHARSARIQR
jgi:hypothetical protein